MDKREQSVACSFDPDETQQMQVLEDGDDPEALERLLEDAIDRGDLADVTSLIVRVSGARRERSSAAHTEQRQRSDTRNRDDEVLDATDFVELLDV
jgi:superfamily II DNA or RNA helicase